VFPFWYLETTRDHKYDGGLKDKVRYGVAAMARFFNFHYFSSISLVFHTLLHKMAAWGWSGGACFFKYRRGSWWLGFASRVQRKAPATGEHNLKKGDLLRQFFPSPFFFSWLSNVK
jgi:hypothetical protein